MSRTIARLIVGYNSTRETIAFEHPIPNDKWEIVASLVRHNEDDPDYIYDYPLDIGVANNIMGMMGQPIPQNLNYFLECEDRD